MRVPIIRAALGPRFLWTLVLLVCLPSAEIRAAPPASCRFDRPSLIGPVQVWEVTCRRVDGLPSDGRCSYEIDLAVVHRAASGGISYDGETYPMDLSLVERVEEDFCGFAAVALGRMLRAVEQSGLLRDERLGRAASRALERMRRRVHYRARPHVSLSLEVEACVSQLADRFYRRRRRVLVITSGTRTPYSQARAMYSKLIRRARYRRLYRKRELAEEIRQTFYAARRVRPRLRRAEVIARMAGTIREQMNRGLYVSEHLREGAVDLRSRNLRRGHKIVLERMVRELRGLKLNREERTPPHFHMQVDGHDPRCGEPKEPRKPKRPKRRRGRRRRR